MSEDATTSFARCPVTATSYRPLPLPTRPVAQVKNGTLREYAWGDMIFNYGCVPQTWEDPKFVHPDSQAG